jgi:hypothetical protein
VLLKVALSPWDRGDWWQARKVETSGSKKGGGSFPVFKTFVSGPFPLSFNFVSPFPR